MIDHLYSSFEVVFRYFEKFTTILSLINFNKDSVNHIKK
jgi:hypothetical protein